MYAMLWVDFVVVCVWFCLYVYACVFCFRACMRVFFLISFSIQKCFWYGGMGISIFMNRWRR